MNIHDLDNRLFVLGAKQFTIVIKQLCWT